MYYIIYSVIIAKSSAYRRFFLNWKRRFEKYRKIPNISSKNVEIKRRETIAFNFLKKKLNKKIERRLISRMMNERCVVCHIASCVNEKRCDKLFNDCDIVHIIFSYKSIDFENHMCDNRLKHFSEH